ncbi:unnamed protein product, partial [Laminaria digitata]
MSQAGVVDEPIFSFYMGNVDTDSPIGMLTLGGVNQTHYEGQTHFGLALLWTYTPEIFWSVMLNDLKVGSASVTGSKEAIAFLDTGASLIQGPFADVGLLAKTIGA